MYSADETEPWHYLWIGFNGALSHRFAELPCVITPPTGVYKKLREVFSYDGTAEEYLAGRIFELYAYLFNGICLTLVRFPAALYDKTYH